MRFVAAVPFLFLAAALDRFTKVAALATTTSTSLIGEVFVFSPQANAGGVLGAPLPSLLLLVLTVVVGGGLVTVAWFEKNKWLQLSFVGAALGIFSNGYDRFAYGFVIDPLQFMQLVSFNIADIMLVVGVAFAAWQLWKT